MTRKIAKIALCGVTYTIDQIYDYLLPLPLYDSAAEGMRVVVPFGRSNRRTEGLILEITEAEEKAGLKTVLYMLDRSPILDKEQLKLAVWLRERCFCTFYNVVKAMLPSGIFYSLKIKYYINEPYDSVTAGAACNDEREKRIISLADKGAEPDAVKEAVGADAEKLIKKLLKAGILRAETEAVRGVGDKTITLYSLGVSGDEARERLPQMKGSPAASDILRYILEVGEAAAGEIKYFTGRGTVPIKSLVKKGLLQQRQAEVYRRPPMPESAAAVRTELNSSQQQAFERLIELSNDSEARAALLFGVTGSGKTQVYLSLVEHVLGKGESAMVLVPEIALTPQLMQIFSSRFGDRIAILHSALSAGQRSDEWKRIREGEADVVLGTRSAVFAPAKRLGVVIIDEEQESSYKSDNTPRYHARDVARYRAARSGGLLVLGSATPSIESYNTALEGRYELITLSERYNEQALPNVIIADMRGELMKANSSSISESLRAELEKNISDGSQSILFLNRRGNSRQMICGECGYMPQCDNCSVALTYHSANNRLMCHYCGASHRAQEVCPECGGIFKLAGSGTQKCEEDLTSLFPGVEILRMDADTTSARRSHEQILSKFREKKAQILLGTQMVAKGLDFENVTLVGIINADQSLYADDFRANERTFSLVTQVVGRAGRGSAPGRAVLQTYAPENPVIQAAASQDYESFFKSEIELRRRLEYPPFKDLIVITVTGGNESGTLSVALETRERLRTFMRSNSFDGQLLGPAQAAIFKLNGRFRYKLMLCCKETRDVRRWVSTVIKSFKGNKRFVQYSIYADINPNEL
ncbi:MAG: primosomal protein N' [Oscillospiraceae bacterium]|jgi:primosomal protein N' (replication factor Y)|nr:primosomal protein N' [Oscillospiraceae bacterium]